MTGNTEIEHHVRIVTKNNYEEGVPVHTPKWLSIHHVKRYRYGQEPYYQEALQAFLSSSNPEYWLQKHTFLLLKPDAFPPRSFDKIIHGLTVDGFGVVKAIPIRLGRFHIRELWRYEYNLANVQRYPLLDMLLSSGDSILLIIRDILGQGCASERLTSLKGASDPAIRSKNSLRTRIGAANGTLNFIHTPDEPIDVVRELGVLLPSNEVADLITETSNNDVVSNSILSEIGKKISKNYPSHELTLDHVFNHYGDEFKQQVFDSTHALRSQTLFEIERLASIFSLNNWDKIILANEFLEFCVPGVVKAFEFEIAVNDNAIA
ncbi:hypothetical protein CWO84_24000 [Methylomonas sp. Kb3]|uniref:nucleoside-diphosphate kinase n=1 Tax=Methylomonas sp. Kb3 TaxID=1611544 RepID=UPI000C322422|nr:nucleoside-diphosphate kinase [Methylomonas sp. Kb3]PKD38273.1 hypothetical protein CWO84_24000 [Methylomonas sp. Kb3]